MTSNRTTAKQAGGLAAFVNTVLLCLVGFDVIDWNEAEVVAAVAAIVAGIGLAGALWAHLRDGSSAEPVAVFAAAVATASSVVGALLVFDAVTAEQGGLLGAVVATGAALLGVPLVRDQVYPKSNLQVNPNVEPQDAFYAEKERGGISVVELAAVLVIVVAVVWLVDRF
jgi:uncharacterized membrane protein YfcA